jgi:hypothetical protein
VKGRPHKAKNCQFIVVVAFMGIKMEDYSAVN